MRKYLLLGNKNLLSLLHEFTCPFSLSLSRMVMTFKSLVVDDINILRLNQQPFLYYIRDGVLHSRCPNKKINKIKE